MAGKKASRTGKKKDTGSKVTLKPIAEKYTKNQIVAAIADATDLSKKQVLAVFQELRDLVVRHVKKRGSGEFTIPETGIRVRRKVRPATKKRLGRNPATGEQIWLAAKPARPGVKISALKALKESVLD